MKRMIKIIVSVSLILLYGFVIVPYSSNNVLSVVDREQNCTNEKSNERSFLSASLFNAIPSENQVSGAGTVPAPYLKNHINDYIAHQDIFELSIYNRLSRYLFSCVNIEPGFPSTVIAFPFNYFW
ncbi:MAG: hypothetical protein AB2L20_03235 [Mangrovibacterium sp.]